MLFCWMCQFSKFPGVNIGDYIAYFHFGIWYVRGVARRIIEPVVSRKVLQRRC